VSVTNGYDSAGRLNATMLLNSTNGIFDSQQYVYDADSRRTLETRYDNSAVAYGYDNIGQVTTATAKESNGTTARLNEQFSYSYDKAGNLSTRTNTTLALAFRVNSVNELTNVTRSGTLTAAGNTAQVATSVSVNGQGAALYGDKTFATTAGISLNNGGNSLTTVVQYASAALTNVTTSQLPTPVAYLNDANGNLTNDGLRSFSYDDQNRLTSVSIANQTLSVFVYDGFGRRRISRDFNWNGTWVQTNEVHYVYDDKLVIQERDANNNVTRRFYAEGEQIGGLVSRSMFLHLETGAVSVPHEFFEELQAAMSRVEALLDGVGAPPVGGSFVLPVGAYSRALRG